MFTLANALNIYSWPCHENCSQRLHKVVSNCQHPTTILCHCQVSSFDTPKAARILHHKCLSDGQIASFRTPSPHTFPSLDWDGSNIHTHFTASLFFFPFRYTTISATLPGYNQVQHYEDLPGDMRMWTCAMFSPYLNNIVFPPHNNGHLFTCSPQSVWPL